jgi:hypothetical protein
MDAPNIALISEQRAEFIKAPTQLVRNPSAELNWPLATKAIRRGHPMLSLA